MVEWRTPDLQRGAGAPEGGRGREVRPITVKAKALLCKVPDVTLNSNSSIVAAVGPTPRLRSLGLVSWVQLSLVTCDEEETGGQSAGEVRYHTAIVRIVGLSTEHEACSSCSACIV